MPKTSKIPMSHRKKIVIISSVIAVAVIGAVVGLYEWGRIKTPPELIGTWKLDPEATLAYNKDESESDLEEVQAELRSLSSFNPCIVFEKNGKFIDYLDFDDRRSGKHYKCVQYEKEDNMHIMDVKLLDTRSIIPLKRSIAQNLYIIEVCNKNTLLVNKYNLLLVYRKIR